MTASPASPIAADVAPTATRALHARWVLLGALLLGIAADLFMPSDPVRSGLSAWLLIAMPVAALAARQVTGARGEGLSGDHLLLLGGLLLGAMGFAFRDAEALYALCFLSTAFTAALFSWRTAEANRSLGAMRAMDVAVTPVRSVVAAGLGAPALIGEALGGRRTGDPQARALGVAGVVIAIPVVLVLGALLVDSDPVFEALLARWFDLPFERLMQHVLTIGFVTWVTAGWMRSFGWSRGTAEVEQALGQARPASAFALLAPAMYASVVLLATFVLVQARALFGGAGYVEATSGLTIAEYARQGFFGLVVAAGLVLALLAVGAWLVERGSEVDRRRFRTAGATLMALVGVLLASAAQRLALYMSYHGLTEARVYAAAGILTVALGLGWCGLTVMRGHRARFGSGLLAIAASMVALLHVLNPAGLAVRVNASRAAAGASFDVDYHASLSADALPALRTAAAAMAREQCTALALKLHATWEKRWPGDSRADWGRWTIPAARAELWLRAPADQVVQRMCGGA